MVFMTLHFPDEVATNLLTIDVSDPKSGTAEFKACAVRLTRVAGAGDPTVRGPAVATAERAT
jgi:formate dehydrogenase major subunit